MPALTQPAPAKANERQLKAWHALVWFLGFFGFMFAVNGIFLWTAITTFPGEDVEKSYLTGLDYNQELARRDQQAHEGWRAEIGLAGHPPDLFVRIRMIDTDGNPLPAAGARLQMRHPASRSLDHALELVPAGTGEYAARADSLAPGIWTAQLSADLDPQTDGDEFKATKELLVP